MPPNRNVTISLPHLTREIIKEIADATNRTPHYVMRQAIVEMADAYKAAKQLTTKKDAK
jgi:predicted transcriptional regulator